MKDIILKEYGAEGRDLLNLFEVIIDCTQYSNLETMGPRSLNHQDNYILDPLASHLEGSDKLKLPSHQPKLLFEYRDLKCVCPSESANPPQIEGVGLMFLQYYYLY